MAKVKRAKDYYTLNPELYTRFLNWVAKNNINKSKMVETLINDHMNKVENEGNK
jgi:hypothetical protein